MSADATPGRPVKVVVLLRAGSPGRPSTSLERESAAVFARVAANHPDLRLGDIRVVWEGRPPYWPHEPRPALAGLLERCERGEVSDLYTYELGRLSRNEAALGLVIKVLSSAGVRLHLADADFSDPRFAFRAGLLEELHRELTANGDSDARRRRTEGEP